MKRGRRPLAVGEVEAMAVKLWAENRTAGGFLVIASELRGAAAMARRLRQHDAADMAGFLASVALWLSMPAMLPAPSQPDLFARVCDDRR